ncbi:hypothetical protein VTI74DRAFT_9373 [Chaetomium olivicolor]
MGLLDDAASVISARTSHSKRSKSHRDHRSSRHSTYSSHSHKERSRSRSRDRARERDRSRHRSSRSTVGAGGLSGFAASIFGGGGGDDDDEGLSYGEDYERDRERKKRRKERDRDRGVDRERGFDDDGARSFFGLPNPSRSSFFSNFGLGGRHSPATGSSYYKRSPRAGFISRTLKKLRRLLRDLLYYAKRHPLKVVLLLAPLITTGAVTALLAKFGLRLPPFVERMLGVAAKAGSGDSVGLVGEAVKMVSGGGGAGAKFAKASVERGRGEGMRWERRSLERDFGNGYGGWGRG